MSTTNFNTENNTYGKLISSSGTIFQIPRFQRDYSWGDEEWEELWADLQTSIIESSSHYMGYLVLQSVEKNTFNVIDGQQRITTLSLMILAAMRNLNSLIAQQVETENNRSRLENIRARFIGFQDNITLISKNKLILNRNNNSYYKDYLVSLTNNLPKRGFKETEHLLRKAFEWFDKRIAELIKPFPKDRQGSEIAKLVENIADNLFFTVINVTNELNAYTVFETLNARGVKLSSTDLLKNYLFSIVDSDIQRKSNSDSPNEIKELEDRWDKLVSRIGSGNLSDFLRSFWLSRYEFIRHSNLFKAIRQRIANKADVFRLMREMDADIDTYLLLHSPEESNSDASSISKDELHYAKLLKLFRVKQHYPLILSARRKLSDNEDFIKVLRGCMVIAFRYNVIGNLPTSEPEKLYVDVAQQIENSKLDNSRDILLALHELYPSDDEFKDLFKNKKLSTIDSRNNKIAKYIYSTIETYLTNGLSYNIEDKKVTIEHILPQSPKSGWSNFTDSDLDQFTYHIGNMMILEERLNKDAENYSFDKKIPIYKKSSLSQCKGIAEHYSDWNPSNIKSRALQLAKKAVEIWRIDL